MCQYHSQLGVWAILERSNEAYAVQSLKTYTVKRWTGPLERKYRLRKSGCPQALSSECLD